LGPRPHPQPGQLVQHQVARWSCHWSLLVAWWVLLRRWVWGTGWYPHQPPPRSGYHLYHRAHWWSQTGPALQFCWRSCHFATIRVVFSLYELGCPPLASSGCLSCRAVDGWTLCAHELLWFLTAEVVLAEWDVPALLLPPSWVAQNLFLNVM
jgi:hypothetical protein